MACIPAGVIGLLLDDWLNAHLYNFQTVAVTLILYGILFIIVENINARRRFKITTLDDLDYKTAFGIGMFQVLSLIPGTSRSGSTIIGASILGTSRAVAAEFSFFLAIPVMLGASCLKMVKFFIKTGLMSGMETGILLIGMVVAFFVSVFVIKFLMNYIRKHNFKVFGYYRIALGIIVLIYAALFA